MHLKINMSKSKPHHAKQNWEIFYQEKLRTSLTRIYVKLSEL